MRIENQVGAIKTLTAANLGITFLYAAAARAELMDGTLREIPLSDLHMEHPFTIVWRKNSPRAEEFRLLAAELRAG